MSYSQGPYSQFSVLPPPGSSTIVSSRKIDFATKKYVTTDDGEFEGMGDVVQRVVLKCSFQVPDQKFISDRENNITVQNIRSALKDMTSKPEPEIELIAVSVKRQAQGVNQVIVKFTDLSDGLVHSVVIP